MTRTQDSSVLVLYLKINDVIHDFRDDMMMRKRLFMV